MTLTADHDTAPETESPAASTPEASPAQRRGVVGWVAAGIALAAAGLLAFLVLADDTAERPELNPQVNTASQTVAEHGSVSAIEHRDGQMRRRIMLSQAVAERGSISAIEHRDEQAAQRRTPSQTVAEHGSISAIEHRNDVAAGTP